MSIEGSGLPDRYGVIGYPIEHSRSPAIHRRFAVQTGQYLVYERISADPAAFEAVVDAFFQGGGRGLNVTVPHKTAALALCDELSDRARLAGALNTLMLRDDGTVFGDNTDGAGLVRDLTQNLNIELEDQHILVAGAGGAAAGVLGPLLDCRPARIVIANRTVRRAQDLAQRFEHMGEVRASSYPQLGRYRIDIVINATAAGLDGEVPPIAPDLVRDTVCYDMFYASEETAFVRWAKQNLCLQAVAGWGMLVEQAAESFRVWRGANPDTGPVLELLIAGAYE